MSTRKNLLFVVPTLKRAGAETQVINLINGLVGDEFCCHLLVFETDMTQKERLRPEVVLHQVRRDGRLGQGLVKSLASIIDQHEIDLIHCTLQISLFYGYRAWRKSKRRPKLVCAIHTTINVNPKFELADRFVYRRLLRRCDSIVFVCHTQMKYWIQRFSELEAISTVVYNGIHEREFSPDHLTDKNALRQELGLSPATRVLLCVAGFRPEKAHDILVAAFARLLKNHPDTQLLLAGDGSERTRIEELVGTLNIQQRVHFLGVTDRVKDYLSIADLSVLASTAVETFSMAMLESMSMGVPVIATDIGGAAEAISPGETGMLVPPGDREALFQAFDQCLAQPELMAKMSATARQRVLQSFTESLMIKETRALFNTLI